jgi:class 3 adenylate cyclase/tetratricopeptide (TPR) repeat protein
MLRRGFGEMAEVSTVTLLFTDLVDSTGLHDRLGDEAADEVRRRHFQLLGDAIKSAGGREVKRLGDGMMAVFNSAGEAVASAVAIQGAVAGAAGGDPIDVRVGINAGEVTAEEGDYYGAAVNLAARLCQAAEGGQILVSDLVRGLVGNRGGHHFRRLGNLNLKGLSEPVAAWSVGWQPEAPSADPVSPGYSPRHWAMPLPAALDPTGAIGFVGRGEDVAHLDQLWRAALGGQRKLVLIAGEPGIGKTRLCVEFCRRVHSEGAVVLYGRADEEAVVPYQPFVESIGEMLARAPGTARSRLLEDAGPELARMLPEHRGQGSVADGEAAHDPETERFRLFESVSALLAAIAGGPPIVLVLDDLHWADKPSLLLLRHIARSPRLQRLLIIGTYRETDLDRRHPLSEALGDLRREQGYERILLRGLSAEEVREYMESAAGHEFSGRGLDVPTAIHRETEGNPFFIAEVIRHMVETGVFVRRDGVWVYSATSVKDLGLPEGVRDVVSRRLARLTEDTNRVLAQASVLGREFEFDVLAAMAGDSDQALAGVEEAIERGLLGETRQRRAPSYAFTHALVRQTLYEEMTMPRKQKLHLKAGQAIEAVHGRNLDSHVAALAIHYRTAGAAADAEKAIDYSIRAGRGAYAASAYEEAVVHLEAALQLIEEEDVGRDREGQVLEYLGDLMHVTGIDRARGIAYLERALKIYEKENRTDRVVQVQSRLGRSYSSFPATMNIPRALEHYRAAEARVSGVPEGAPIGYLYLGIAAANLYGMRVSDGVEAVDRAISIATEAGNEGLWVQAAAIKGFLTAETGKITPGLELVEEAWQRANRLGHVLGAFFAAWILGGMHVYRVDSAACIRTLQRELGSGRLDQIPEQRGLLLRAVANAHFDLGEIDAARKLGGDFVAGEPAIAGIKSSMVDGNWEGTVSDLKSRWAEWKERGLTVFGFGPGLLTWLAIAQHTIGDLEGELATLEEGLDICQAADSALGKSQVNWLAARLFIDRGEPEKAPALMQELRDVIDLEAWGGLGGRLEQVEAEMAMLSGDLERARTHSDAAMSAFRTYSDPLFEAEFRLRWGRALASRGERNGAQEHFDAAVDIYRRTGYAQRWIDRVEEARSA